MIIPIAPRDPPSDKDPVSPINILAGGALNHKKPKHGDIVFSREMSSIAPNMGGRILLCDDLSDTGITFNKSIDWLKAYGPIKGKIEDIKTATLWKKQKSSFEPDFCAVKLKDNPWIVQPFEIYEEIRIEEIKKKHQK